MMNSLRTALIRTAAAGVVVVGGVGGVYYTHTKWINDDPVNNRSWFHERISSVFEPGRYSVINKIRDDDVSSGLTAAEVDALLLTPSLKPDYKTLIHESTLSDKVISLLLENYPIVDPDNLPPLFVGLLDGDRLISYPLAERVQNILDKSIGTEQVESARTRDTIIKEIESFGLTVHHDFKGKYLILRSDEKHLESPIGETIYRPGFYFRTDPSTQCYEFQLDAVAGDALYKVYLDDAMVRGSRLQSWKIQLADRTM